MVYRFVARISCMVNFTDDEINLIKKCAETHYDSVVESMVKQGGFMYGALNIREFCKEESEKECEFTFRQLDLITKALENPVVDSDSRYRLNSKIVRLLHTINNKTEIINNSNLLNEANNNGGK